MFSDLDDDLTLNWPANQRDKLAKLFEENSLPDITFKFTTPKQPPVRPKNSQNSVPLKVIFAKAVEAFQMKVGGYKSEGKVGLAIIGNDEYCYYQLYMYKSDEKKVASAEVSFNFDFLVQEHNYATFKDVHNIQWSVHFDKTEDLISFSKEIALARWKTTKGQQCKLIQEAFKGKSDVVAKKTDLLSVSYKIYTLSPEHILQEEMKTHTETAPANASTWETNLIGAGLKSKRFVIVPSHVFSCWDPPVPEGFYLMLEMEVQDITSAPPSSIVQTETSVDKKEGESLSGRIARIGYALPSLQETGTSSTANTVISDSIKATPPIKPPTATPNTSNISMYSKDDICSFNEPSDISTTSQFNALISEVRTSNSEIRMNVNRVTDKVDVLLSKMDFVPNLNHKIIPTMEKFQNLDGMINKLSEQNSAIMLLLEKNSPLKFESTINEIIQLKKRNVELTSFLEVTGSTSQILKDKVAELTQKNIDLERVIESKTNLACLKCSGEGDGKLKNLDMPLKNLHDENYSLLRKVDLLEKQKNELLSKLSLQDSSCQAQLKEKDSKISQLQEEVDKLDVNLKRNTNQGCLNKEMRDVLQGLINKIYKILKEELKKSSNFDLQLDQTLASILRATTEECLENLTKEPKLNKLLLNSEEASLKSSRETPIEDLGNLSFSPSQTHIPVPKPRKPILSSQGDSLRSTIRDGTLSFHQLPKTESVKSSDSSQSVLSDSNHYVDLNQRDEKGISHKVIANENSPISESISSSDSKTSTEFLVNYNNSLEPSNIEENESSITESLAENIGSGDSTSKLQNKSNLVHTKSDNYNPYASTHYTPLLPTSPPPISDDFSDESQ